MRVHRVDGHVGAAHAEIRAHPLGPMTHIRQLIHFESTGGVRGDGNGDGGRQTTRHGRGGATGQATKLEEARTTDLTARGGAGTRGDEEAKDEWDGVWDRGGRDEMQGGYLKQKEADKNRRDGERGRRGKTTRDWGREALSRFLGEGEQKRWQRKRTRTR